MTEGPVVPPIDYEDATDEVRLVYDDIKETRGIDAVDNFWKVLANDPELLRRTWADIKQLKAPGALDRLNKDMIYNAVSATNGCEYCTYSHTAMARARGLTDAQLMEVLAVVGMANETNRLSNGLRPPIDVQFTPR
jgi:AhpD family alkylhydroperoxidase